MKSLSKLILVLAGLTACLVMAAAALAAPAERNARILETQELGAKVVLTDKSVWKVPNPDDQDIAYNWLPMQKILIKGEKMFINLHTGERIDVEMIKAAAPSQAQKNNKANLVPVGSMPTQAAPVAPAFTAEMDRRLNSLERKLEDINVRLKMMELKIMRLERAAGVTP